MTPGLLLALYALVIIAASLGGGLIPILYRLAPARMEMAISFVAGLMIGLAVADLLPHAMVARAIRVDPDGAEEAMHEALAPVGWWLLLGILVMFLVERLFCMHEHAGIGEAVTVRRDEHTGETLHEHGHTLTWTGATVGMTIHSMLAGIALAAAVAADSGTDRRVSLTAGAGTFLMVALHKPFDALSIGTLLATGGHPLRVRHVVNALFALATPLGMVLFALGLRHEIVERSLVVSNAIAFSAGMFICIGLSDLLPELRFHHRDRIRLIGCLILGLSLAWGIARLTA